MAQALLGLLLLASLVCCFFAAKRWHWSQVFLGEVLFLSAMLGLVLAADVLHNNQLARANYSNLEQRLEQTIPLAKAVVDGTRDEGIIESLKAEDVRVVLDPNPDNPGAMQGANTLEHRLAMITRVVGRKWEEVKPQGPPDPASGAVTVKVEFPTPHNIEENAILYVFQSGEPKMPNFEQGPQYLGEFRVTGVAGDQVAMAPEGTWSDYQKQRLGRGVGVEWTIYETMPVDQHPDDLLQLFAGVEGNEFDVLVPPQVADEYKRHGSESTVDDDKSRRIGLDADGNVVPGDSPQAVRYLYQRQLHDYAYEFLQLSRDWVGLQANLEAVTTDLAKVQKALTSAKALQAFREEEQRRLKIDVAGAKRDRAAIETHLANIEASLSNAKRLLESTLADNLRMVRQLADSQFAALAAINGENEPVPAQPADGLEFNP